MSLSRVPSIVPSDSPNSQVAPVAGAGMGWTGVGWTCYPPATQEAS